MLVKRTILTDLALVLICWLAHQDHELGKRECTGCCGNDLTCFDHFRDRDLTNYRQRLIEEGSFMRFAACLAFLDFLWVFFLVNYIYQASVHTSIMDTRKVKSPNSPSTAESLLSALLFSVNAIVARCLVNSCYFTKGRIWPLTSE